MQFGLDRKTGGVALTVGYAVLIVLLFRNPADGFATATETIRGVLFFILLPVAGLASGAYTYFDGPVSAAAAFISGSYLAAVGIVLAFLPTTSRIVTGLLGIALFGLSVFALIASLRTTISRVVPEL